VQICLRTLQTVENKVGKLFVTGFYTSSYCARVSLTHKGEVKVMCTSVQALRLCTGRTAHRGGVEVYLYSFLTTALEWGEGSASRPDRSLPPRKDPVLIVQEAVWAPGPVWTGAENLASTGIRSPYRPAPSQSLYRLRYPAYLLTHRAWLLISIVV